MHTKNTNEKQRSTMIHAYGMAEPERGFVVHRYDVYVENISPEDGLGTRLCRLLGHRRRFKNKRRFYPAVRKARPKTRLMEPSLLFAYLRLSLGVPTRGPIRRRQRVLRRLGHRNWATGRIWQPSS